MVFQDISASIPSNSTGLKKSAAHLADRFFSFFLDYLVISPFVFFLLYFSFTNGINFWRSNPTAPENDSLLVILISCYVVFFSLIQSFFIKLWGATPGQYFLKIQVQFDEPDEFNFFRVFFRQTSFWLSFLLLGIPFIGMMTNKFRHTFYDRVGHISIVSRKNESEFFIFEKEYQYWQSFMMTLIIFTGFLLFSLILKNYSMIIDRNATFAKLEEQKYFCEEIQNVALNERLQVAVALNLADQLSDECLDKEANFVLWKQNQQEQDLAYYAKSLTAENRDQEIDYLIQSCDGQNTRPMNSRTIGCRIAHSFLNNKIEELYLSLKEENFLSDSLRYELSLILNKRSEIKNNFSKLEKYNSSKQIKKYRVIEMISQNNEKKSGRSPAAIGHPNEQPLHPSIIDMVKEL
ncbi:MAG: RDD family protein [Bdellovibrionota bacterium]